jgi:hypothetical protein
MIDREKLEKDLKHLELQYANYRHAKDRPELMAIDREAIAESVIQRFETAYDTLWKNLDMTAKIDIPPQQRESLLATRMSAAPFPT